MPITGLNEQQLVVVTGATGFIAQHCVQQLVRRGYRVRATTRTLSRAESLRGILVSNAEESSRLGFRAADLTKDEGWQGVLDGAVYVLHLACPVPVGRPRDESEVMIPAVEGTMRVLRAAAEAGVRRVVHTSSIAAVLSGVERLPGAIFTEADWSDPEGQIGAYAKSKTLAERAAWEFQAGLPEPRRFELCAANPVYVIGPSLDGRPNASNEIIGKLVHRELPGLPRLYFPVVDVRDVAAAHLLAMTDERAAGERFILSAHEAWYGELAAILRAGGHRVPTHTLPDWVIRVVGRLHARTRAVIPGLGWEFHPSSEKARRVLGWRTRPLRETVLDAATSILTTARRS